MKFNKIFQFILFTFSLLNLNESNAFIFCKREFQNEQQKISGWGDAHFGCCDLKDFVHPKLDKIELNKIHQSQANDIVNHIKKENLNEVCVIVEDLSDLLKNKVPEYAKELKIEDQKNNFSCCLENITELCKKNQIKTINVEFRDAWNLFTEALMINAKDFLNHFNGIVNEINNYNDEKVLNDYYRKIVRDASQKLNFLEILNQNKDKKYNEIEHLIKMKDSEEFLKIYFLFIDAKILHEIYQNKDKKNIHICVGDAHIRFIEFMLKQIGYKKNFELINIKDSIQYPLDIKKYLTKTNFDTNNNVFFVFLILVLIVIFAALQKWKLLFTQIKTKIFKIIFRASIIFFMLLLNTSNDAYIFAKNEFKKDNVISCWGDVHYGDVENEHPKYNIEELRKINKNQCNCLIDYLKQNNVQNSCVFVEDILDIDNTKFKKEFKQINKNIENRNLINFLSDINKLCKQNNIYIENIECRYAGTLFFTTIEINAEAFLNNLYELINEIKSYNDNKILNKFYKQKINDVLQNNAKFLLILKENKDLFYNEIEQKIGDQYYDKFFSAYCGLVDAKIAHGIFANKNKEIHICVGQQHIKNIEPLLENLGYKKIETINNEWEQPLNIQNFLPIHKKNTINKFTIFFVLVFLFSPPLGIASYMFIRRKIIQNKTV